jgi:AcrR family transcriptional regulator
MTERVRGRPRDPRADDAIMTAALELFVERGIDGTSMEQIAKRAGVAKLTVYRRWSSKEALLAKAFESRRGTIPQLSPADIEDLPLAEIIDKAIEPTVDALADPTFRPLIARLLGTAVSHPSLLATYWEHYILPRRRVTHVMLERAKQDGQIDREADNDVLIDMMVGPVIWRLLQPEPFDDPAEIRQYLRTVYRQVGLLPA